MRMSSFESIEHLIYTVKRIGSKLVKFHVVFFSKYYKELNNEMKDILMDKNN